MFSLPDIHKIKDDIIDKTTDIISEKIKEATDGSVNIESILNGQIKVDGNGYLDKAVELLNHQLDSNGLNEIDLPELSLEFEKSIACGILLPGKADIDDGNLTGLASFSRIGDAEIRINALSDPLISARASVGIKKTAVDYTAKINLLCFGPEVSISGSLTDVTLNIDLQVDRNFSVVVHNFQVSSNGDVKLNFENLSPYDFLADKMTEDMQQSVKSTVLEYLEKSVKTFLDQVISTLPISL